jgi:urease accessory protein
MKFLPKILFGAATAALFSVSNAHAHHAMDGETPGTLMEGLISGLAHPVIGLDHLAFIVAAGIAAGVLGLGRMSPLAFVAASIAGVFVHLALIDVPAVEPVIAVSVVLAGGLLALSARGLGAAAWVGLFAVAGLFHGYAYGEGIVGAEATPLAAYLLGLLVIQSLIALACHWVASRRNWLPQAVEPRLVGAAAFGVGLSAVAGQVFG